MIAPRSEASVVCQTGLPSALDSAMTVVPAWLPTITVSGPIAGLTREADSALPVTEDSFISQLDWPVCALIRHTEPLESEA